MSNNISDILKRLDSLTEGLNADQNKAKQLPALFKPRSISVLTNPTDPAHPMDGYAVGASESRESVSEADANDPWEKGWRTFFRRGDESDNPYQKDTTEYQQWLDGYREGEAQPHHYDESKSVAKRKNSISRGIAEAERNEMDTPEFQQALAGLKKKAAQGPMKTVYDPHTRKYKVVPIDKSKEVTEDDIEDFLARGGKITQVKPNRGPRHPGLSLASKHIGGSGDRMKASRTGRGSKPQGKPVVAVESVATEDIISTLKDKLGDYLADISKEIKKDPDLVDKLAAKAPGDAIGPAVKTITTDDGHQIQIHGNEDDGFRVSIKNKPAPSKFKNLDEAVMACEMYCARRRENSNLNSNTDYLDEA